MRLKSLAIRILHNLHLKHILEKNPQEVQKKSKKKSKLSILEGPGPFSTRYLKQIKKLYETSVLKLKKIFKTKSRPSNFVQISLKIFVKCWNGRK